MSYIQTSAEKAKRLIDSRAARILAIETSCDETSAAVVENGRSIISNVISTQLDYHRKFGGVVPEIASRMHIESLNIIIEQALSKAKMSFQDIDAVAVTKGPGLVGALLVGVAAAKAIAYSLEIPLVGVNHIEGHIHALLLAYPDLKPPFISLVVSGGHTNIIFVEDYCQYKILSKTRDDAVGEAYDKVGRLLGLRYPGGPEIDMLSRNGEANISFPSAYLKDGDFSFSGIKTAVINYIHSAKMKNLEINNADIAASFQYTAVNSLTRALFEHVEKMRVNKITLAGGVAANGALRAAVTTEAQARGAEVFLPPLELCTDNAAMIGSAGYYRLMNGECDDLVLNAHSSLKLPTAF